MAVNSLMMSYSDTVKKNISPLLEAGLIGRMIPATLSRKTGL